MIRTRKSILSALATTPLASLVESSVGEGAVPGTSMPNP